MTLNSYSSYLCVLNAVTHLCRQVLLFCFEAGWPRTRGPLAPASFECWDYKPVPYLQFSFFGVIIVGDAINSIRDTCQANALPLSDTHSSELNF